jgi:hypothetical protein
MRVMAPRMNESMFARSSGSSRPEHRPVTIALVLVLAATTSCGKSSANPPVTSITACPEGASLVGAAPPEGRRQRCQRSDTERHGATREWYDGGRERSYSEWWEGAKHGRFKLWYSSGRVRSEGAHRHGVPAGHWTYYREDGSVEQDHTFSVAPPAADWLAQALAGHPPPREEMATAPAGSTGPTPDH